MRHASRAVHHHEGAVKQVMGDGIMALFGAPPAHEDHAVRACTPPRSPRAFTRTMADLLVQIGPRGDNAVREDRAILTVRTEQMQDLGDAAPNKPVVRPCAANLHWIEFQLVDTDGAPVPGEPFEVRLPDQSLRTGNTDRDGKARFESITAGQATIRYTGLEKKEWKGAGSKGA